MVLRPRHLTWIAAAIGAAVTIAVSLIPSLRFAYRSPELHIAFDTAEALIALTAAYLVFGRLQEHVLLRNALLAFALLLIGSANLLLLLAPPLASGAEASEFPVWTSLAVRLVASGAIAWASFSESRRISRPWAQGWRIPVAAGAALAVAGVVAYLASITLSFGLAPHISPVQSDPVVVGDPMLLGAQLGLAALFATSAIGFTRVAETQEGDPFLRWLGPGTMLSAIARVNFFLFPSIYTEYIYVGDFLRLAFYLLLLYGASQEVRRYWRRLEADIVERERLNAELEALSLADPLTGLSNRRGFDTLADHAMIVAARSKEPLALLFIDLNEMKAINDVHGHDAGDEALREVASILIGTLRDSDVVARLGGDEFCALMVGDATAAEKVCSRLQAGVESANGQRLRPYRLSLSIGVAHWDPAEPQALATLMETADAEMYANKRDRADRPAILVVEDDPSIKQLIRLELSDGFEVWEASSAAEALSVAARRAPQLVILDYYLPDANGLADVQRLRSALGAKVPLIVLTGASDVDEAAVLRAGADDYLVKPFVREVLVARIERLIAPLRRR